MTKEVLLKELSKETGLTQKDCNEFIGKLFGIITADVASGGTIKLNEIGTFGRKLRAERPGRNPLTGVALVIPESYGVRYSPSKQFREAVKAKADTGKKAKKAKK